jgi:hypothetical protein
LSSSKVPGLSSSILLSSSSSCLGLLMPSNCSHAVCLLVC